MYLWMVTLFCGTGGYPIFSKNNNITEDLISKLNQTSTDQPFHPSNLTETASTAVEKKVPLDLSKLIELKENDWRDEHTEKMIIWSIESPHHPEFGKNYPKGKDVARMTRSSQVMSFMILGSVIGFILYTYFTHVLLMRRLNREEKAAQLHMLIQRSALMMAGAPDVDIEVGDRKHSLINMFRGFRL